ncbi:MAG TPA: hypothetical protein VGZ91_07650 [Candidatus Sulfotelmatobacter sp.]|jgi:hypothetical protein|nr:hypothetical protein [Candidatus Sulfotelmatobacter sp.]
MNRTSLLLFALALLFVEQAIAQSTTNFYVSPTGNDSILDSANSASNPFKTPNRAQLAITDLGACSSRTKPVIVYFETGLYPLGSITGTYAGPWTLGSGTGCSNSHVTFTNYQNGTPVISGGVKLAMTRVGTSSVYKGSLPTTLAGYSPEALYYNNTRRFRVRYGAVSGTGLPGLEGSYYRVTQLTCGSSPCYDRFQYAAGDPPDFVTSWSNYQGWNPGGQPTTSPCYSNTTQPSNDGDIEILIFEKWTMSRERIACIDTTSTVRTVYLEGSTNADNNHGYITGHRYIVENANTGTATSAALLPGQFFIDRTASPYVLYYKAQSGETPNTANVVIPVLTAGTGTGAVVSATDLQYVTFSNLVFAHDNYVPPLGGFPAAQSNNNLPALFTCMDCSNTTWNADNFTQTIGNALWLETSGSGTPTTNTITYSNFFDLGSDGLVYGNLPRNSDTSTSILNSGSITENLFQGYGRMYAGASGLEHLFGTGTVIENNDVTDGYNTGIGVCIPANINCGGTSSGASASGINGEYNHVWNIGKGVTDDMGAFYIATINATGNYVQYNRLHDVQDAQPYDTDGYGGNGIYIDSTTGKITVQDNLVYRVTEHTLQNTVGPAASGEYNTIFNNILAYGRVGMFDEGAPTSTGVPGFLTEIIENNIFYFDRVYNSSCGIGLNTHQCSFYVQSGCTVLQSAPTVAQTWNPNLYWDTGTAFGGTSYAEAFYTVDAPAMSVTCPKDTNYTFTGWQGLGQEAGGAVFSPGFVNPSCADSTAVACEADNTQDNYAITGVGVGQTLTITTGNYFTAFSMTAAGRQSPTFTPSAIQDTFPTLMFDTTTSSGNF